MDYDAVDLIRQHQPQVLDWAIAADRFENDRAKVLAKMQRAFQSAMDQYIIRPTKLVQYGFSFMENPQRDRIWMVSVEMEQGHTEESFAEWWVLNERLH